MACSVPLREGSAAADKAGIGHGKGRTVRAAQRTKVSDVVVAQAVLLCVCCWAVSQAAVNSTHKDVAATNKFEFMDFMVDSLLSVQLVATAGLDTQKNPPFAERQRNLP